ncbi:MAG: DUF4435 domain-containing protein [Prevotella sp.]|nr:DUF4435 domain-containing protein [Prevotella sp.]
MMKNLKDNITSEYFSAANKLKSKQSRRKIVAYVESYDDVLFWRTLLGNYEDENRFFEIMLPSHNDTLERGKRSALMNLLYKNVGQDMIACVDADYDYLLQGATQTSKGIIESPYIFHTYAYSIENLQCYAPSLHNVCVMVTLNDHAIFDFVYFMREYSKAIFPLLVWSILFYRRGTYGKFSITDFNNVTGLSAFNFKDPEPSLASLRNKVFKKVNWLRKQNPGTKEAYKDVEEDIKRLGVTPETTYLYIQGHHLFDKIIVPILNKVCSKLIRDRENEIRSQAVHATQLRNELSCYSHSTQDIPQMLKKNFGYTMSPLFRKMQEDVERFLRSTNQT